MKSLKGLLGLGNLDVFTGSAFYFLPCAVSTLSGMTCRRQVVYFLSFLLAKNVEALFIKTAERNSSFIHQVTAYDDGSSSLMS